MLPGRTEPPSLYLRVVAKHPDHQAIAISHAMRELPHLAFALGQTDRPFDPACQARAKGPGAGSDSQTSIEQPSPSGTVEDQAAVRPRSLREAALDLVRTFELEPAPAKATEKRDG